MQIFEAEWWRKEIDVDFLHDSMSIGLDDRSEDCYARLAVSDP